MTRIVLLYVNENSIICILCCAYSASISTTIVISECHYTVFILALEYTYRVVVSIVDVWYNILINRFTCLDW